jgi:hypothetical protein
MATLRIRIDGANATFVRPTLGVQPRVVVRVNGRTWRYDPANWVERAGGLELAAVLVPLPEPPPAPAGPRVPAGPQLVVEAPTGVHARFERAGDQVRLAFSVPDQRPVAVPGSPPGPLRPRVERLPAVEVLGSPARVARSAGPALRAADGEASMARPVKAVGAGTFTLRQPRGLAAVGGQPAAEAEAVALGVDPLGTPILAGHVGLNAVQVAVADGAGRQAGERLLCFLERDPRQVVIVEVLARPPGFGFGDPEEFVAIANGGPDDVDLAGWTVRNLAQDVYEFGPFVLRAGRMVRVWTGQRPENEENLSWRRPDPVWSSRGGGTAILADASGRDVSHLDYVPGAWP